MAYLTLAQAKSTIGIASADTTDDALITDLIGAAKAGIDSALGRTFEATTATRYYDAASVRGQDLRLDTDLLSVTTLMNGDGTVVSALAYALFPRNSAVYATIRLKVAYGWAFTDADSEISVLGNWGWSATPPGDVLQVAREYVAYLYRSYDRQTDSKLAYASHPLPEELRDRLAAYRRRF